MKEDYLSRKQRIPRRASHDLIIMIAKWGNNYYVPQFKTDAEVKRYFCDNGYDFESLVEQCRNYKEKVPFLENLIGSTWNVDKGCKVSRVDNTTGKEGLTVQGPGIIASLTYWSHYESANEILESAINKISYELLQSAITKGIASIEAYINYRSEAWNKINPTDLLTDSKQQKISFEDKIDIWIPKMSGGKKLDKSNKNWSDFKVLLTIRDNLAIHSKNSGFSISLPELSVKVNKFKTGIAGLLIQLHQLFNEKIPAVIIRGYFAPEVEVLEREV